MPITIDALIVGLTAGAREFTPSSLWGSVSVPYNKLMVGIFGSAVTTAQSLNDSNIMTAASFTVPTTTGAAAPNFQVKSYLDSPVVCNVVTAAGTGTVQKIAFVLTQDAGDPGTGPGSGPTTFSATDGLTIESGANIMGYGNDATTIPDSLNEPYSCADVFMVITVSPGIAVTSGGYLTVKGYVSGVSGSNSFTYITLQSGS